jgi:serine/threonine-protein kinase HipA
LEDGLLPKNEIHGKIKEQFQKLGEMAGISANQIKKIIVSICSNEDDVKKLIRNSYLSDSIKRNYEQAYLTRLNKLIRI